MRRALRATTPSLPNPAPPLGRKNWGRTLTFEASNLEDMNSKLQKIFGNKNTELKHEQEVNDTSGKLMVKNHVSGQVDCSIVCSPEGTGALFKLSGSNGVYTRARAAPQIADRLRTSCRMWTLAPRRKLRFRMPGLLYLWAWTALLRLVSSTQ